MKKLIVALLCTVMFSVHVYADFDYSILNDLSKEELIEVQAKISDMIDSFDSEQDPVADQTALIEFEDREQFFSSRTNRKAVQEAIDNCETKKLVSSLLKYNETHNEDAIDEVIDVLNMYGDYKNIVSDTDYFTGNTTNFYDGYKEIDETHYFRIYYFGGEFIEFGRMGDKRYYTSSAELKIIGQDSNWHGIKIWDKYHDFSHLKTEDGKYIEKANEHLSSPDIDYLLNDMSGQVVIRFYGQDGTFDYECTEEDKEALQNMAKYFKTKDSVGSIMIRTGIID